MDGFYVSLDDLWVPIVGPGHPWSVSVSMDNLWVPRSAFCVPTADPIHLGMVCGVPIDGLCAHGYFVSPCGCFVCPHGHYVSPYGCCVCLHGWSVSCHGGSVSPYGCCVPMDTLCDPMGTLCVPKDGLCDPVCSLSVPMEYLCVSTSVCVSP